MVVWLGDCSLFGLDWPAKRLNHLSQTQGNYSEDNLSTKDKMLGLKHVHYSEVPL